MRKPRLALTLLFVGALFSGPALAQKVIHFANGTSMPIREYVIEDSMIHVDLGGDGYIAFPVEMVDRVETAGIAVPFMPSNVASDVVRQKPDPNREYPVTGHRTPRAIAAPPKSRGGSSVSAATGQPYAAGGAHPLEGSNSGTGAHANPNALRGADAQPGMHGITPRGTQWVTGGRNHPGRGMRGRPEIITMQPSARLKQTVPRPANTPRPAPRSSEGDNN